MEPDHDKWLTHDLDDHFGPDDDDTPTEWQPPEDNSPELDCWEHGMG